MATKTIILFLALAAIASAKEYSAVVHLEPHDVHTRNVTGELKLTQTDNGPVTITGTVNGLSPGDHGFHVHEKGDFSNGCVSFGAHFNPDGHTHGAPQDSVRHVGDLGNIQADNNGVAVISISDTVISLTGSNSILGRGMVVHVGVDDLGKGGHTLSLTTGNAGDRAACGVIGVLSPTGRWTSSGASMFLSSQTLLLPTVAIVLLQLLLSHNFSV